MGAQRIEAVGERAAPHRHILRSEDVEQAIGRVLDDEAVEDDVLGVADRNDRDGAAGAVDERLPLALHREAGLAVDRKACVRSFVHGDDVAALCHVDGRLNGRLVVRNVDGRRDGRLHGCGGECQAENETRSEHDHLPRGTLPASSQDMLVQRPMADALDFVVDKTDLRRTAFVPGQHTAATVPDEGAVLVRVDTFALTANNVTYGVAGDMLGYWRFFPAADTWGRIPVWGFGDVVRSHQPALP